MHNLCHIWEDPSYSAWMSQNSSESTNFLFPLKPRSWEKVHHSFHIHFMIDVGMVPYGTRTAGGWFNIKMTFTSIVNPIVKIRRSYDRLISTMGFPILVRWHLYIQSGPWVLFQYCMKCLIIKTLKVSKVRYRCSNHFLIRQAAQLPNCLSNFKAICTFQYPTSWAANLARYDIRCLIL